MTNFQLQGNVAASRLNWDSGHAHLAWTRRLFAARIALLPLCDVSRESTLARAMSLARDRKREVAVIWREDVGMFPDVLTFFSYSGVALVGTVILLRVVKSLSYVGFWRNFL